MCLNAEICAHTEFGTGWPYSAGGHFGSIAQCLEPRWQLAE